ncbi:LuxR C-terminal-related transcriptional regulator [Nonomuraea rubra]
MAEVGAEVIAAWRVRELRQALGWTQQDVAERLRVFGVSLDQSSVARIESGSRLIRLSEAIAFAKVFDIDLERLISVPRDAEALSMLEDRIEALENEVAEAAAAAQQAIAYARAQREAAEEARVAEAAAQERLSARQAALRALEVELRTLHALRAGGEVHVVRTDKELVAGPTFVSDGQQVMFESYEIKLTRREIEVGKLAVSGQTNAEIARGLALSVRTVETHLMNLYKKLGVSSRRELERIFPSSSS